MRLIVEGRAGVFVALGADAPGPEPSASPDSDAEAIFYQAVDRNFVSRLALEVAATLGAVDRILAGATAVRELASESS